MKIFHHFAIYTFAILYPAINVVVNTNMWPEDFQSLDQAIRHGSVIMVALVGMAYRRMYLDESTRLRKIIIFSFLISLLLVFFEILKLPATASINYFRIYSALSVFVLIIFGATMSHPSVFNNFSKLFIYSLVASLLLVSIISIAAGNDISSSAYGRERFLLGYAHPGRLAQHLFAAFMLALFTIAVGKSARMALAVFATSIAFATFTKLVIALIVMIIVVKVIRHIVRSRKSIVFICWYFGVLAIFTLSLLLFLGSDELVYELTSGRTKWWLTSIALNVGNFTPAEFAFGAFGELVTNFDQVAGASEGRLNAFRVDNGYLELFYSHGLFGLILVFSYLTYVASSGKSSSASLPMLVAVFAIFSFAESGLFAIGSFMSVILIPLILHWVRLGQYHLNYLNKPISHQLMPMAAALR